MHKNVAKLIVLIVFGFFMAGSISARLIKISGDMVPGGDVAPFGFKFSPDSSRIVFSSDQEVSGKYELYSVSVDGGPRVKLSGISLGSEASQFAISPDSKTVVYTMRNNDVNIHNLFRVPIGGGIPIPLTNFLPADGRAGVYSPAVSPDGKYIVYQAVINGQTSIHSVPIAARTSTPLSTPQEGYQQRFEISSDSQYVVYETVNTDGDLKISSVPIAGGAVSVLNVGSLDFSSSQNNFDSYKLSSTGTHVVYRAELGNIDSIYSVPIQGGVSEKLNIESDVSVGAFDISLDGKRAIYIFNSELFSTPIAGGAQTKLSTSLIADERVLRFQFVPDGSSVFYITGSPFGNLPYRRFRVPINGGASTSVNFNVDDSGYVFPRFSPNSEYMVYFSSRTDMLSSRTDNDEVVTKINVDKGPQEVIRNIKIAPDSSKVFYTSHLVFDANQGRTTRPQLYSVSINGGREIKISELPPLIDPIDFVGVNLNPRVTNYLISPDSKYVVFTADMGVPFQQELYSFKLVDLPTSEGEFCIPVAVSNSKYSVICL